MTLAELLRKQFLITSFIGQRLQIINYIKNGYDVNKPILMNNAFLHLTAHIYYRSVIVDLYALFGPTGSNNKYSFHGIFRFSEHLIDTEVMHISSKLEMLTNDVTIIKELRHKQIAHFDFESIRSISLNFDNLDLINNLFSSAQDILDRAGGAFIDSEQSMGFDRDREYHSLRTLEQLVEDATIGRISKRKNI